ncbi:hypothetical protein DRQ36_04495 [bacterium]|nr:MAG: hypothetical protein DRQ36_04495 [bacterium]
MNEMEKLFWQLFNAESEEEVHKIVKRNPLLKDNGNWFPYGGRDINDKTNFKTFENQQPHPLPALVEKITNSIDALLMKKCYMAGIDPTSPQAPKNMSEAVERFFGIKNGDFSEVSSGERRDIASEIQVIATGNRETPCILIYDNGEGQHPENFPDTFLSIHRENKIDIHFVQGKYNMGSTGAVVFCGKEHRYQLIASKRNDSINSQYPNNFGFTLVRRHSLSKQEDKQRRCSWYEYFIIKGKVPNFASKELDIGLWNNRKFASGSIVKLYSYQLPTGSRSDIQLGLWRDLNQYLYRPALPILLYEKRGFKGKTQSKLMLGNKTRIVIDERDKKEITIPLSIETKKMGRVDIEATVFKHGVKQTEFVRDKAVIFTMNGQVHGSEKRSFISRDLGLQMLRDYLLVNIDCTNTNASFYQDLLMGNRFNLKQGHTYEIFRKRIIETLKTNEQLRKLNQDRKNRIMRESSEDRELLKRLIQAVPLDKDLLRLLKKNGDLDFITKFDGNKKKSKSKNDEKETPKISKRFPSIFKLKLKKDSMGKKIKSIPLNGKGIMEFETDVEDEYLFRPKEKGEFQLEILGIKRNNTTGGTDGGLIKVEDIFDVTIAGPTNNSIRITFEPQRDISVGDEVEINARLTSPDGDLESIFYVRIVNPQEKTKPSTKSKDMPSLPKPIRVFKKKEGQDDKTWEDLGGWKGDDIVKLIPSDKTGKDDKDDIVLDAIAINMDCNVLKKYISRKKIKTEKELNFTKDEYFAKVYLHSLFLYGILDKINKSNGHEERWDVEDIVPQIFKTYTLFLLYADPNDAIISSMSED